MRVTLSSQSRSSLSPRLVKAIGPAGATNGLAPRAWTIRRQGQTNIVSGVCQGDETKVYSQVRSARIAPLDVHGTSGPRTSERSPQRLLVEAIVDFPDPRIRSVLMEHRRDLEQIL